MKVKSFLLGLLAMTAIVACKKGQPQEEPEPRLSLSTESVTAPAEGTEFTFTVTSNQNWTVASDKDWATVNPTSGDASEEAVIVTVTVDANGETAERTAVVTVAAGDLTKTLTITQSAKAEQGAITGQTPDGRQWIGFDSVKGEFILLDLGVTEAGLLFFGNGDGESFQLGSFGEYRAVPADETSGVIYFYDQETLESSGAGQEWTYSDCTAASVTINIPEVGEVEFELYDGYYDFLGVAPSPTGLIEDGQYWFLEGTMFAEPCAEGQLYGYLPSSEGVDNGGLPATLATNAFTFTYMPDYSHYTIQDRYGRYLGTKLKNENEYYNSFQFVEELPSDGTIEYYLWNLSRDDFGEFDIYNVKSRYSIFYNTDYGAWGIYPANKFSYPYLIRADNPVESLP